MPTATTRPPRSRARAIAAAAAAPTSKRSLCITCSASVHAAHRLERAGADVQRHRACARRRARRARRAARRRSAAPPSAPRPRPAARRRPSGSARRRRLRRRARCRAAAARGRGARAGPAARPESAAGTATRRCRARPSTSASKAPAKRTTLPAFGDLLARTCATTTLSASIRSTSASTAPPLALTPNSRALITRGVVDDEQVAGAQQLGQVANVAIARGLGARVEQARGAALGGGMLGDQLARQREVEIAQAKARGRRHRQGKILPWPLPRGANRRRAPPGRAAASAARPGARQARPGARHRPRAAPAAALRGRDAGRADRVAARRRDRPGRRRRQPIRASSSGRAASSSSSSPTSSGDLVLRFLHFYPSQQKTLAVGKRVRARGEARGGFFGLRDDPSGVQGRDAGDAAADRADAGLPEHGAAVAGGAAQGGRRRPRARRPRRAPAAGHRPARACRPCARRSTDCTSRRPDSRRRRSRTARIRPGSASSSRSCSRSSSRSCSPSASAQRQRAPVLAAARGALHDALLAALPFALTARAAPRRRRDRRRPRRAPCRCIACCKATSARARRWSPRSPRARAIDAGWQCALMAPTEILAEQHLKKLVGWLAPLGVTVAWLTGSRKGKKRDEMLAQVASGEAGARRRHARGDRGAGALRAPRPGDHRRAASLRRRAAAGAAREAARPGRRSSRICS